MRLGRSVYVLDIKMSSFSSTSLSHVLNKFQCVVHLPSVRTVRDVNSEVRHRYKFLTTGHPRALS